MAHEVFALDAHIAPDPVTGTPMVLPLGRDRTTPETHHHEEDPISTLTETAAPTTLVPALDHSATLAFELSVAAREPLGPSLVRFTLTGPEHFGTNSHPLDLRIKLIIPGPAASADHFRAVRPGALLDPATHADWYRSWLQIDPTDRGWMRTHPVREHRAAGHPGNLTTDPELDIDVVLHLDPVEVEGQGVAARWARDATVGDTLTMLGPNRHLVGPDYGGIEFRPGTARPVLLVGDETALPAIGSILEALPASISGHALIEVPEAADQQQLLNRSGVQVTWLPREGRPDGELLDAAVRELMSENAQAFRDAWADAGRPADGTAATPQPDLEDVDIDATMLWETTTGHGSFYACWRGRLE